jgi:serine/threonine protein kinase
MAPEVLCGKNHNFLVDYYAIGVIGYECMFGHRPYSGRSRKEIREQILSKQINISKHDLPKLWSVESSEFINKLLERKWSMRLGKGGCDEVKAHSWFKDFDW